MIKEREVMDALPRSGFVRDYVDYAMSCTDSNNSYHLAAALTAITQTTPLSYAVPFASPIHSNLYTMIVGDSSKSRKTTAMNILQNIMREALPGSIGEMPGSQEGLNEQLRSQQRQLVLYTEFGEFLSKAEQGYMMPLKTSLTSLWDCTPIGRSLANSRRGAVTDPRLSLFCGIATSLLERHTDQADWTGGFIARFLTFHAEPERAFNAMPIPNSTLRASLVNQLAAMSDPTVVPGVCKWLDSAGKQMWDDWMNDLKPLQKSASPRAQAACSRVSSMVCKIALLLCWDSGIARMGGQFHIGLEELESSLKIGNLHVKSVLELGEMVTGNKDMRDRAGNATPWTDVLRSELTALGYGWALMEITYKRRRGDTGDRGTSSDYDDGAIGWASIDLRAQTTLQRWEIRPDDEVVTGFYQLAPMDGRVRYIPAEKFVLFTPQPDNGSPEGLCYLAACYESWRDRRKYLTIQGIGLSRYLAGIPVIRVPGVVLAAGTAADLATKNEYIAIGTRIKQDDQAFVMLPSNRDKDGNLLYDISLLSAGGDKPPDVLPIIEYCDRMMLTNLWIQFLSLQQKSGIGAGTASTDATSTMESAVEGVMDSLAEVWQEKVRRLCDFNAIPIAIQPRVVHGKLDKPKLASLGQFIRDAGIDTTDPDIQAALVREAGLPAKDPTGRAL